MDFFSWFCNRADTAEGEKISELEDMQNEKQKKKKEMLEHPRAKGQYQTI